MENPYENNPHYDPTGQQIIQGGVITTGQPPKKTSKTPQNGAEVHTQDVKSEEVTTDEPRKRGRKARKSDTESQPTDSNDG